MSSQEYRLVEIIFGKAQNEQEQKWLSQKAEEYQQSGLEEPFRNWLNQSLQQDGRSEDAEFVQRYQGPAS